MSTESASGKHMEKRQDINTRISKFASKVLRHEPQYLNLELSKEGWCSITQLLEGFKRKGLEVTKEQLTNMVKTCEKQRFEISGDKNRIRCVQGHSIGINLELQPIQPPDILYHGTVIKFIPSILKNGLLSVARDWVHLSHDKKTATNVGMRRGRAVLLEIDSKKAHEEGVEFFQAKNDVWLVNKLEPKYITLI